MSEKRMGRKEEPLVPFERIASAIYLFRGYKVMLDRDLAVLYGVETKELKRAVRRNIRRFPDDFMFVLDKQELRNLRCQFGTSSVWGGTRYPPMAFTEQGIAMLSGVLMSARAVEVNIAIMRAFVRLREFLASHHQLRKKLADLENKIEEHSEGIRLLFEAMQELTSERVPAIGFHASVEEDDDTETESKAQKTVRKPRVTCKSQQVKKGKP
jgi:hypothetical protein